MLFELFIPDEHPALAGHFPDQPIIPAALLLDELCYTLTRKVGQSLYSVKQVRFAAPIQPNRPITVKCQEKKTGEYRFGCSVDGALVAKGIVATTPNEYPLPVIPCDDRANTAISTNSVANYYQSLPHSGSMCLLDTITTHSQNAIYCIAHQQGDNPLRREGKLPMWAALEYAAQAVAFHGLLNKGNTQSNPNIQRAFVVGIKYMTCLADSLYFPQKNLEIAAQILAHQPQAARYEFIVASDNKPLSFGQISVVYE